MARRGLLRTPRILQCRYLVALMSALVSFAWTKKRAPKGEEFHGWLHFAYGTLVAGRAVVRAADAVGEAPLPTAVEYVRQFGDDVLPEKTNIRGLEDWKTSLALNFILSKCDEAKAETAKTAAWTVTRWQHGLIKLPHPNVDLKGFEVWPTRAAPPRASPQPRVSSAPAEHGWMVRVCDHQRWRKGGESGFHRHVQKGDDPCRQRKGQEE